MTATPVVITFRRFDYREMTPFQDIDEGSYIRYSPTPLESYNGKVVSKKVELSYFQVPIPNSKIVHNRLDIYIAFGLLLQIPTHLTMTPRIFATYPLDLIPLQQIENIYPTISDFYYQMRPMTVREAKLWIEGWKWWYLGRTRS
jgi:hypothetical protein